jgi:hypothetical protein
VRLLIEAYKPPLVELNNNSNKVKKLLKETRGDALRKLSGQVRKRE